MTEQQERHDPLGEMEPRQYKNPKDDGERPIPDSIFIIRTSNSE